MKKFFSDPVNIFFAFLLLAAIAAASYFMFFKKPDASAPGGGVIKKDADGNPLPGQVPASKINTKIQAMITRILTSDDAGGWKQWRADWGAHFGGYPTQITDDFKQLIFANAVTSTATTDGGTNYGDYTYKTSDTAATKAKSKGLSSSDISAAASVVVAVIAACA